MLSNPDLERQTEDKLSLVLERVEGQLQRLLAIEQAWPQDNLAGQLHQIEILLQQKQEIIDHLSAFIQQSQRLTHGKENASLASVLGQTANSRLSRIRVLFQQTLALHGQKAEAIQSAMSQTRQALAETGQALALVRAYQGGGQAGGNLDRCG